MFDFFHRFPWALEAAPYVDRRELLAHLSEPVIAPAAAKVAELHRSDHQAQIFALVASFTQHAPSLESRR
jgi:hypothetical protein